MPGGAEGAVVNSYTELFKARFAQLEMATSVAAVDINTLRDVLAEINLPYLQATSLSALSNRARTKIQSVLDNVMTDSKVLSKCSAMVDSKAIVGLFANLMRTSYGAADQNWLSHLEELPGPAAEDICKSLGQRLHVALSHDDSSNQISGGASLGDAAKAAALDYFQGSRRAYEQPLRSENMMRTLLMCWSACRA